MSSHKERIQRIRSGGRPRVLDLFSGCGGISMGLHKAGCEPIAGLDKDRGAMETWYYNHRPDLLSRLHKAPAWDITAIDPGRLFADLGIPEMADEIDIICGGPPCQAYSRIGKGKLRSLGGEDAHLSDERGGLYLEFLRFVKTVRPLAVMVENVPDSTNYGGENIPEEICKRLSRLGYRACWTLLNSAEYGVPQFRRRVFIQAIHESVGGFPRMPDPTHRIIRPPKLKAVQDPTESFFERMIAGECGNYAMPRQPGEGLLPAIGTEAALDDLPRIRPLSLAKGAKLCQDVRALAGYVHARPRTAYQQLMRSWPGFETDGWVTGNTIRDNPRDFPIFRRMKEGDLYPDAIRIADELFHTRLSEEQARKGRDLRKEEIEAIRKATVPPYDVKKFEGKWTKFRREQPSHTVVAHLQFDTYSHIHYDSNQARAITVREAARLQSFPDGFRFLGSMKEAFMQIGNAVPPLLAEALGQSMMSVFRGVASRIMEPRTAARA